MTSLLKLENTVYSVLAFISSSYRVTDEDCLSETVLSDPTLHVLNVSTALKGTNYICSFVITVLLSLSLSG